MDSSACLIALILKDFTYELYSFAHSFFHSPIKHLLGLYLLCALQQFQFLTVPDGSLHFCDLVSARTQELARGTDRHPVNFTSIPVHAGHAAGWELENTALETNRQGDLGCLEVGMTSAPVCTVTWASINTCQKNKATKMKMRHKQPKLR